MLNRYPSGPPRAIWSSANALAGDRTNTGPAKTVGRYSWDWGTDRMESLYRMVAGATSREGVAMLTPAGRQPLARGAQKAGRFDHRLASAEAHAVFCRYSMNIRC